MATLTTEWQTVSTTQKNFSSTNWIKYHIDAKVGSPNVAAGTIPIYTRLRSEVNANGWAGNGYKWSLTYAQHTSSSATWEGSDTWYFGTETILETITPTNIKYDKEGYKSVTLTAVCQNNYHTVVNATINVTVDLPRMSVWYIDVGGILDGASSGNTSGWGTFCVDINGVRDATNVSDYYKQYIPGTTYKVHSISAAATKNYGGVQGSLEGTTGQANTYINLKFNTNIHTNTINHYAAGFVNGEGNAGGSKQFISLGQTSFRATYGTTITYDSSKFTTIPNGYQWYSMGGSSFASAWTGYPLGQQFTQPDKGCSMQFDYAPTPYTITYNLNGGTNNSANPTNYNVLYGVTFANPTKKGYTFTGWTIDGATVTGINPGATANFADSTALYNGLASRTTGNKTVTANWSSNKIHFVYYANNGDTEPFVDWTVKADSSFPDNHYNYGAGQYKQTKPGYVPTGYYGTTPDGGILIGEDEVFNSYEEVCNAYGVDINTSYTEIALYAQWEKAQATTKVKVNGAWVTGNFFVKKDGTWVAAQKLYVKKDGSWKEAI